MAQMTPEQQRALEEKLAKMSPEELSEFQKQQCIFCQIIAGSIPSRTIYKDEHVTAVMDINPAAEGHLLVMPNEHYAVLPQMPQSELVHLAQVLQRLSHVLIKSLGVEGTTIFAANGAAAGQRANHVMVHVIPRIEGDKLPLNVALKDISKDDLEQTKRMLRDLLSGKGGTAPITSQPTSSLPSSPSTSSEQPVQRGHKGNDTDEGEDTGDHKPDLDAIAELLGK